MRYTTIQPISMNSRLTIKMRAYDIAIRSAHAQPASKATYLQTIHRRNQGDGDVGYR